MYRARDAIENERWLAAIEQGGAELDVGTETVSTAQDLFLSSAPTADRSKKAIAAASLYAATLITSDQRSQVSVAEAMGVARLSVQSNWKAVVETAGLDAPSW
ncbi:MAG: transcription initiation factor IIB family protein [Halobacteriaceae archaeon]